MAAEFIGYNVLVTLRAPPDATVQGVVADVIGQRLMLRNGMYTRTMDATGFVTGFSLD
jgi:hypothetical protein